MYIYIYFFFKRRQVFFKNNQNYKITIPGIRIETLVFCRKMNFPKKKRGGSNLKGDNFYCARVLQIKMSAAQEKSDEELIEIISQNSKYPSEYLVNMQT